MEETEAPTAELPALTDPSKIAELVNRLYHQLPGQVAVEISTLYAETLIRTAAARLVNDAFSNGLSSRFEV